MLFWCKLGGVPGGGVARGDMELDELGVEGMSDIVCESSHPNREFKDIRRFTEVESR